MIKNLIIIVLSVLVIFASRKKLKSWAKKVTKKLIPIQYYRRLKRIIKGDQDENHDNGHPINLHPIFPVLSKNQEKRLSEAIRLTFTGDLILLKDMVENGYDSISGQYHFDSMFKYIKEYYDEADCNISVFEGPVAGADKGYSTS